MLSLANCQLSSQPWCECQAIGHLTLPKRHLIGRFMLDVEIAHGVFGDRGLDALDLILRVDRGVHAVLPEHRDRDDVHLLRRDDVAVAPFFDLLPSPERPGVRAGHPGGLDESRRVHPQVQLVTLGILGRNGHRRPFAVDRP